MAFIAAIPEIAAVAGEAGAGAAEAGAAAGAAGAGAAEAGAGAGAAAAGAGAAEAGAGGLSSGLGGVLRDFNDTPVGQFVGSRAGRMVTSSIANNLNQRRQAWESHFNQQPQADSDSGVW